MSVQSEIERINGNVASTYTALSEMGATMPAQQNSDNLPGTVRTVPQGGGSGGKTVQTDWNQTDETAPDFLKNKPFGDFPIVILEEQELPFDAEMGGMMAMISQPIQDGDRLIIVYDGVTYECVVKFSAEMGTIVFGNLALLGFGSDTGEPFIGAYMDGIAMLLGTDEASHTVKIVLIAVVMVPDKYTNIPKLYINSVERNSYLYTDVTCTNKAEIADVPNHAEFTIGFTMGGLVALWLKPISVIPPSYAEFSGYGTVTVLSGTSVIDLRTAEYTPTT